jgi:hypothetical protein
MSSGILALKKDSELKIFLEDLGKVSRGSKHHTIITAAVNIFPMETSFDE